MTFAKFIHCYSEKYDIRISDIVILEMSQQTMSS